MNRTTSWPLLATAAMLLLVLIAASVASAKDIVKQGAFYQVSVTENVEKNVSWTTITATGKAGYHCNTMYPWKLTVKSEEGTKIYKKDDAAQFNEAAVVFKIPSKGSGKAVLALSLCDEKKCMMEKVDLGW